MNKTKLFSFRLKDDLKERLEKQTKFGITLTHLINRAIELQLDRDARTEEGIKANEAIYGSIKPPEDLADFVK
jgi:predicted transcriptional regulator